MRARGGISIVIPQTSLYCGFREMIKEINYTVKTCELTKSAGYLHTSKWKGIASASIFELLEMSDLKIKAFFTVHRNGYLL